MARIPTLPSLEIIRGLKGILDFYVWKGLPCVRAWPKYRPAKQTAASLAAALIFGAIVKSYPLLGKLPLEAYREDALDQPRTARDLMVTGIYGNLHEASMSDFLDLLVECRNFLSDLTALLDALHSIDTDEIVARIEHSVLPDGASTAAAQATQLTALQKIDDLQDALESKALDRLLVRGMDQLFSYKQTLALSATTNDADAGTNTLASGTVPAGEIWHVTHLSAINQTTVSTRVELEAKILGAMIRLVSDVTPPAWQSTEWQGDCWLVEDDWVQAGFRGCNLGDDLRFFATGQIMTLET